MYCLFQFIDENNVNILETKYGVFSLERNLNSSELNGIDKFSTIAKTFEKKNQIKVISIDLTIAMKGANITKSYYVIPTWFILDIKKAY